MQKIVTHGTSPMTALQGFWYIRLADFDEECIVKRLRVSVGMTNDDITPDPGDFVPWKWAIIQTDTLQAPTVTDFSADTRIIASGIFGFDAVTYQPRVSPLLYDHTITMRKLKDTAVWFIWAKCDDTVPLIEDASLCFYSQVHYIED